MSTQPVQDPQTADLQPLEEFVKWLEQTAAQFNNVFVQERLMLNETKQLIAKAPLRSRIGFNRRWKSVKLSLDKDALAHWGDLADHARTIALYFGIVKNPPPSPHVQQAASSSPVERPRLDSARLLESWRKYEEKTGILSRLFAEVQESAGNHEHQEIGARFSTLASAYSSRLGSRAPQPSS